MQTNTKESQSPQTPSAAGEIVFRASARYWVLAALALGAAAFWVFSLLRSVTWETLFFMLIGLVGGLWALWMATTTVTATATGLTVKRYTSTQLVDYQQIRSSSETGRFFQVLAILYHPRAANGLVDTAAVRPLIVPGLANQADLVALLEQRVRP